MKKKVYIFGDPVEHSKSPAMHTAAYQALKIADNFEYLKKHVKPAELKESVALLRAENIAGANITVPHKEAVIAYLDEIDPQAQKIGAVNTVVNNNGKLIGYNTDAPGYLQSLKHYNSFEPKNKKIAVFGAGGAARAIVYALAEAGAVSIVIGNRTKDKAIELAQEFSAMFGKVSITGFSVSDAAFLQSVSMADLVINTTSVGMPPFQNETPLKDTSIINSRQLYSDIVYQPPGTVFLKDALLKGAQVNYGYGMLLWQGVLAFELFTNKNLTKEAIKAMEALLIK